LNVNVGNNSRNGVDLIFCLVDKSTGEMITGSSISPDRITNINCSVGGDTSISLNKTIDVEANRDWKTDAGVRNLAVPTTFESVKALSSTDITTNVDGYTTVATPETPATNYTGILGTIIEVLNSIKSGVQSIVTFITDFFKNIIVALETVLQPVIGTLNDIKKAIADAVTAITAPIVQAISNIKTGEAEADLTTQTQNYNIPDLFVLILKVIIACISLVLRFIVYLLKMPFVEADTWGMSTNTINGIDFAKNVKIPYLNLSMWSIISSVISITYSITIMRKIRRFYSV
jgi:hypothetical protein